jgi:hypothetical protein
MCFMQNLAEVLSNYVRETRRLESLPSSTETTFYPDLKLLLNSVLKSERLPFDVITGTSEGGGRRRDMPDFVLGDSSLFVGVYGEVKRADRLLPPLPSLSNKTTRSAVICRKLASCFYVTCAASGFSPAIHHLRGKTANPCR